MSQQLPIHVSPSLHHTTLNTTFHGVQHPLSTPSAELHQYRGIKYGVIPARFRRSTLFKAYQRDTNATNHGPIAPQTKFRNLEQRLYGLSDDQLPPNVVKVQNQRHDEFECLSLNITRPGKMVPGQRLPVMLWIHGGGNVTGSGSDWIYDPGALVLKSMTIGKPVVIVAINYRLGLLGFGASHLLKADNAAAGEEGVGNYGLYDQRIAFEWVSRYIDQFGGDPSNVTLFASSHGAADIHCHLLSAHNHQAKTPLFHRAILQSGALADSPMNVFDIFTAGSQLTRIMSALRVQSMQELRRVEPERLVALTGERVRPVDDGVFFRKDWRDLSFESANFRQDVIIGDCALESVLWSIPAALWSADAVVRRIRAISQSVYMADTLLRAYDVDSDMPEDEVCDKVLDMINDAHFAWVVNGAVHAIVDSPSKLSDPAMRPNVYRYVFDQASPFTDTPHHAVDLLYLFANVPFPVDPELTEEENEMCNWDRVKVRDTMQDRWVAFANGERPWKPLSYEMSSCHTGDKVYVFGPEGETGERSWSIFEGRRRIQAWGDALEPLGMQIVQKIGLELGNGPPVISRPRF